jgi:hypothetical protein
LGNFDCDCPDSFFSTGFSALREVLAGKCEQAARKSSDNALGILRLMGKSGRFEKEAANGWVFLQHSPHIRYILRLSQVDT